MFSLLFSFPRAVDFYIGALLSINASPFLLTGADDKAHIQLQIIRDNMYPQHSFPCAGSVLHGGAPGPICSCKCRRVAGFFMIFVGFSIRFAGDVAQMRGTVGLAEDSESNELAAET